MALGSNWMSNFDDDPFDKSPSIDEETARILRNEEGLDPYEVASLINERLREKTEDLNAFYAAAPEDHFQEYDAGREAVIQALEQLRSTSVSIEPTTADQLATLDHDRRISRGIGSNVETTYPGSEPLENRDLRTVPVRSGPVKTEAHKKVSALLAGHTPLNSRETANLVNKTLAREAEELMVQEVTDAQYLDDLDQRGIEDKPENVGAQRYERGRQGLAAAVAEVRRTHKVALTDEVTDHLVTLDHDGLMSQQLGVEVAELYGRNPGHQGSRRAVPDFSREVDSSLTPAPILRQPASAFSREVREAQRDALAARQPAQTLRPVGEALRDLRAEAKKPKTVVPAPIPKFEKKTPGPEAGPELG